MNSALFYSRIRIHYTDSAREALDLANKSYERLVEESDERHKLSILINKRDVERVEQERRQRERATVKEEAKGGKVDSAEKENR